MRLSGIVKNSVVDGEGLRDAIFFQGCSINCNGCHNASTHDKNGGEYITPKELLNRLKENGFNNSITLSGGEPLEQDINELNEFLRLFKKECKENSLTPNIWIYSGRKYEYEDLISDEGKLKIFKQCLVLVDGPFILNKKKELLFRGSENQRLIDLKRTLKSKRITLYK